MKKRDYREIKEYAYFGSLGLQVVLAIFIGLWIGRFLDGRFDTDPWLTIVFFVLGVIAGFKNIALAIKKIRKY